MTFSCWARSNRQCDPFICAIAKSKYTLILLDLPTRWCKLRRKVDLRQVLRFFSIFRTRLVTPFPLCKLSGPISNLSKFRSSKEVERSLLRMCGEWFHPISSFAFLASSGEENCFCAFTNVFGV